MSLSDREARFQVDFLRKLQRLLAEGGFVATYKYALLHAIADLSVEYEPASDGTLRLTAEQLAARFIDLYWRQVQVFPIRGDQVPLVLRQNTGTQAAVVKTLSEMQALYGGRLPRLRDDPSRWRATVRRVARTIKVMPLWKLQTVGSRTIDFLHPNTPGADHIVLRPGVSDAFRGFHGLIVELVRAGWIRFIRRYNDEVRDSLELYGFLFGTERACLEAYRHVLEDLEGRRCFYCDERIRGEPQVDHFIPWARYPHDLGHNFVLAHVRCNARKSDHLAAEEHLERWVERNRTRGGVLADTCAEASLPHDRAASIRITSWAYEELEAVGGDVWVADREFRPLSEGWRRLLGAA